MIVVAIDDAMALTKHLNDEISSRLQGTARVSLDYLSFDDPDGLDDLERDNVERLAKLFELEGCNRLSPAYSIPGSISANALQASLHCSSLTIEDLQSTQPPTLCLPHGTQIECLQGRHRIAALRKFKKLHPWWTVRLYVGMSIVRSYSIRVLNEEAFLWRPSA